MPQQIEDNAGVLDFKDDIGVTQWTDDDLNILGIVAAGTTPSNTALASSAPGGIMFGSSVTFTATVTPPSSPIPTGFVSFFDGASSLADVSLVVGGNTAAYTTNALSGGSHTITATYHGDTTYAPSTSAPLTQNITTPVAVTFGVSSLRFHR